jgi:hypothetical protein
MKIYLLLKFTIILSTGNFINGSPTVVYDKSVLLIIA